MGATSSASANGGLCGSLALARCQPAHACSPSPSSQDDANDEAKEQHNTAWSELRSVQGIVCPGGFGNRGVEGKIATAKFARENKIPYLGICLGMQMLVVEYARSVCGWEGANSVEFDEATPHPTIIFMPEIDKTTMGGTMRLGARKTILHPPANGGEEPSLASMLYNVEGQGGEISERHRHRYEVNPEKVKELEAAGLNLVGRDDTLTRMEIAELPRTVHPFYMGVQYHPEFKSRPLDPSPPFLGLLLASSGKLETWLAVPKEKSAGGWGVGYPSTPSKKRKAADQGGR